MARCWRQNALCILPLCYLGLWLGYVVSYIASKISTIPFVSDFNHYYASSWLLKQRINPYCMPFASLNFPEMQWSYDIPSATNTPFHIFLVLPLTLLEVVPAWNLWILLNVVLGLLAIWLIICEVPGLNCLFRRTSLVVGFLASYAFLDNILYSQVQLIILFLVIMGWRYARKANLNCAGFWWGLSCAVKPVSFLLFFYLLFVKPSKPAIIFATTFLVATILPTLMFGIDLIPSYVSCAIPIVQKWSTFSLWNISLSGMIHRSSILWQLGSLPKLLPIPFLILLISILFTAIAARSLPRSKQGTDFAVSIISTLSIISLEVAWPSYLIFLVLPLAVIWGYSLFGRRSSFYVFVFWAALSVKPLVEVGIYSSELMLLRSLLLPLVVVILILASYLAAKYACSQRNLPDESS